MNQTYTSILLGYLAFVLIAALLTGAERYLKSDRTNGNTRQKAPGYILINLIIVSACWAPQNWHLFTTLLALIGGIASWEIVRALMRTSGFRFVLVLFAFAFIVLADFVEPQDFFKLWFAVLLGLIAAVSILEARSNLRNIASALSAALVYILPSLAAVVWIRRADAPGLLATFLYLIVAANDAFAQITGQLFGRNQIAPQISPAKTIEGAVGGLLFATLAGSGLGLTQNWNIFIGAATGLTIGFAAQVGDLIASGWKRALGIVNYSEILGAQGGILDRFDSLIFAAPVFYLLLVTMELVRR